MEGSFKKKFLTISFSPLTNNSSWFIIKKSDSAKETSIDSLLSVKRDMMLSKRSTILRSPPHHVVKPSNISDKNAKTQQQLINISRRRRLQTFSSFFEHDGDLCVSRILRCALCHKTHTKGNSPIYKSVHYVQTKISIFFLNVKNVMTEFCCPC